jgi:hypothetical protein
MRLEPHITLICGARSSVMLSVAVDGGFSQRSLRIRPHVRAVAMSKPPKGVVHETLRQAQRSWLMAARDHSGLTLTEISRRARLHAGTLNRFMNDDGRGGVLQTQTIALVSEVTGYAAAPEMLGLSVPVSAPGMRESEAALYTALQTDPVAAAIEAIIGDALHLVPWQLQSRALQYEGYMPGDVLIVDLNAAPRAGDVVCVQLYDWRNPANTETVFRLFEPPFLIASGPVDAARKPRLIAGDDMAIRGVMMAMLRRPGSRNARPDA